MLKCQALAEQMNNLEHALPLSYSSTTRMTNLHLHISEHMKAGTKEIIYAFRIVDHISVVRIGAWGREEINEKFLSCGVIVYSFLRLQFVRALSTPEKNSVLD